MSRVKLCALNDYTSFPAEAPVVSISEALNNAAMQRAKDKAHGRKALRAMGERVEAFRRQKGWNRTTLAARAGVTVTTVRGCEEGTKVTQPTKLQAIAKALGIAPARLEADDKDPRVKHWSDEDYEIGNWYHNATRQLKNRIWALQEISEAGKALIDPQFTVLLEGWAKLTQEQKAFVLNSFTYISKEQHPKTDEASGGVDAVPAADPKTRGPHR
jgi:ribosome-binding protein aMBF1 (putative translation factor)